MYKTLYKNPVFYKFLERPWYGYNIYQAAALAKRLSIPEISVIEFGVATGNGIINIEKHVKRISDFTGVKFQVYGFDTACGLPDLLDYRDVMHNWQPGLFKMDFQALQEKLEFSTLIIGRIEETLDNFFDKYRPAPIGCIMFDVDLYSSTSTALKIFNKQEDNFLPRVRCYFDDILGNELSLSNEYIGEALAIKEFNQKEVPIKVTPISHILAKSLHYKWYNKCYAAHLFNHPQYTKFINNK